MSQSSQLEIKPEARSISIRHFSRNDIINGDSPMSLEYVEESAAYLIKTTKRRPKIGIICGSGLAGLGELVENADVIPYSDIPHFPVSTAPGHLSRMLLGTLNGVEVMLMQGRFHLYEGYSIHTCSMPVRVMKCFGIETLIVSNAAGGLADRLKVGDVMIIKDHVNLQGFGGKNPLKGKNDERFGFRFFSMKNAYERSFRKLAHKVGDEMGLKLQEGVYTMMGGPNFETPAELRLLRVQGVHAVGMSTVHEVIAARHCGIKVFAFSLITNLCEIEDDETDHEHGVDVIQEELHSVIAEKGPVLKKFVQNFVKYLNDGFKTGNGNVD